MTYLIISGDVLDKGIFDYFAAHDHHAQQCTSIITATVMVEELNPRAVIIDGCMRGSNAFLKWLKRETGSAAFVATDLPSDIDFTVWGADGVIEKPLTKDSISAIMAELGCDSPDSGNNAAEKCETEIDFWDISKEISAVFESTSCNDVTFPPCDVSPAHPSRNNPSVINQEVITFWGSQGGAGRTTAAVLLAKALSSFEVVLIDLNFKEGPGDVNAILGLPAMPHIGMLIDEPEDRRKGFLASLMKPTCASFAVVQPPPTIDQAERITPDDIIDLVDQARRMFQVVIIDAPADMSATTLEAIDLSTYVVLMSTGHSGSLARLNSLMTFIRKDVSKTLVLNKYPHSERKARAIAHYLDLPLAAAVDNVQDFYKLEEKGRLVDTSNCVTDIGVNGIVRNIFGFDAMIARPAKSPGSAFRAGFLKSRRAGGAVENGKGQ